MFFRKPSEQMKKAKLNCGIKATKELVLFS